MSASLTSPAAVRRRCDQLIYRRDDLQRKTLNNAALRNALADYLGVTDAVRDALDTLSDQLFGQIIAVVEDQLTRALQEVLEQPLKLKATRSFKSGVAAIDFHVERNGQKESILEGQGGSVANVLSVGLRLLALTTLDENVHRRFLVLDEQDCWLHPSLVPRLVKIIHDAGRALNFQTIMISHHEPSLFEPYAEKIYRLAPDASGAASATVFAAT